MAERHDAEVDPRTLPPTIEGVREAWSIVERTWRSTFDHVRQLPEAVAHERVNDEWSFVETQRHLLFATDVWVRRTVVDDPGAWHPLGMPPDLRTGQPDPKGAVREWGIDIWATPSLEEILAVRDEYLLLVRGVVDALTPDELARTSTHNPPWIPDTTALPKGACLGVVIREEWEHHGFARRDLALLEADR